jgi:hypothetical protein
VIGLPGAEAAEVKFKVSAEGAKPSTFRAYIYKGGPGEAKSLVTMIGNDELVSVSESTCTPATIYTAKPVLAAVYQSNPTDMHRCKDGAEISFSFKLRKVASKPDYMIYLNPDEMTAPGISAALQPAISEMRTAYSSGEVGKAVKLSTELSTAFATSGDKVKAAAFRNLTIATTRDFVYSLSPDTAPPDDEGQDQGLLKWQGRLELAPDTKNKLVEFQTTCGAEADNGRIGWKTMSCMPGGNDIQLRAYVPGSAVGQ